MKGLDLPSLCVPFQLLDCIQARAHGKIREQFPFDSLAILRGVCFGGMDSGEDQFRIVLLLDDRRTNHHAAKAQLEHCSRNFSVLVTYLERVQASQL